MRRAFVPFLLALLVAALAVTYFGGSTTLARALPNVALAAPRSFDGPGVGLGGTLSPYGVALSELVARGDTAALRRLADREDVESQLYGLTGLSVLAPAEYEARASALRQSSEPVPFRYGCMFGGSDEVGYVISLIDDVRFGEGYVRGQELGAG